MIWDLDWHYQGEPGAPAEADRPDWTAPRRTAPEPPVAEPVSRRKSQADDWIQREYYPLLVGPGCFPLTFLVLVAAHLGIGFFSQPDVFAFTVGAMLFLGFGTLLRIGFRDATKEWVVFFPLLVLTGFCAFELIPNSIDIATGTIASMNVWFFFVSFWLFINIHHYFIDNVIGRFTNPRVREYLLA